MAASTPTFPFRHATYLASVKSLLTAKGHSRAVEVMSAGTAEVVCGGYDNLDGGTEFWDIKVTLPIPLYARLTDEERTAIQQQVSEAARDIFRNDEGHSAAGGTSIIPALVPLGPVPNVNNQGGVNPKNPPHIDFDDLKFRSRGEVRLSKALKKRGVLFAPLPVFMRGSVRREPDFVIVKDAFMLVVELDGPDTHRETPVEAERRLAPFTDEGVKTARISATECDSDADAERCADRLLAKFERFRAQR